MRLLVEVSGNKYWCIGNIAKAFEKLLEVSKDNASVKLLTVFYDSKKERRRFKRELYRADGNLIEAAKNYLEWYNRIKKKA